MCLWHQPARGYPKNAFSQITLYLIFSNEERELYFVIANLCFNLELPVQKGGDGGVETMTFLVLEPLEARRS